MAFVPQEDDNETKDVKGRPFSAYGLDNDISLVPVDKVQDDLFDEYHRYLDGDVLSTIPPDFPNNQELESPCVLDCGCGTGAWIDYLMDPERDVDNDTYQDASVVGIDIFHRSTGVDEFIKVRWNLNASLLMGIAPIRDAVQRDMFDLINSRFLVDGINDGRWKPLIKEYSRILKRGGWLQMAELEWTFHSENGHSLPDLARWSNAYSQALRRMRPPKNPDIASSLESFVRADGGFEQVRSEVHNIRLGGWQSDDGTSASATEFVHGMLESLALVPFTRKLGMDGNDCAAVVEAARKELRLPNARIFQKLTVVYARRPQSSG